MNLYWRFYFTPFFDFAQPPNVWKFTRILTIIHRDADFRQRGSRDLLQNDPCFLKSASLCLTYLITKNLYKQSKFSNHLRVHWFPCLQKGFVNTEINEHGNQWKGGWFENSLCLYRFFVIKWFSGLGRRSVRLYTKIFCAMTSQHFLL